MATCRTEPSTPGGAGGIPAPSLASACSAFATDICTCADSGLTSQYEGDKAANPAGGATVGRLKPAAEARAVAELSGVRSNFEVPVTVPNRERACKLAISPVWMTTGVTDSGSKMGTRLVAAAAVAPPISTTAEVITVARRSSGRRRRGGPSAASRLGKPRAGAAIAGPARSALRRRPRATAAAAISTSPPRAEARAASSLPMRLIRAWQRRHRQAWSSSATATATGSSSSRRRVPSEGCLGTAQLLA